MGITHKGFCHSSPRIRSTIEDIMPVLKQMACGDLKPTSEKLPKMAMEKAVGSGENEQIFAINKEEGQYWNCSLVESLKEIRIFQSTMATLYRICILFPNGTRGSSFGWNSRRNRPWSIYKTDYDVFMESWNSFPPIWRWKVVAGTPIYTTSIISRTILS